MSGGSDAAEEAKLKGLSKYFNSTTTMGRARVAMATYGTIGLLVLYFSLKPKSKK